MERVLRTVLWRRLDGTSMECCRLLETDTGVALLGTVVCELDDVPANVSYEVRCSRSWLTQSVYIECNVGENVRTLHLVADRKREWYGDGDILLDVRDCMDVDLSITPATNALPIRRLKLAVGESQEVLAAWVRFPMLTVEPLSQTYTRLAERRYRYESNTGFVTELTVDDDGLIENYPGGWERVAEQ